MAGIEDLRITLDTSSQIPMVRRQISWQVKTPHFLVTCIILSHTVPCALAMERVRNVGAPGKVRKTLCCAHVVKMSLDPVTSQEHHNDQHLAQKFQLNLVVWGGESGRAVEVDRTSQLFIPREAFPGASQLDPAARNVRTKPTSVQSNPSQCPHCSRRLELKTKSTKPQILGLIA